MENFFYNDKFYIDLTTLCEDYGWDIEDMESLPIDFKIEVEGSQLKPIVKIDAEWITERIDEERFSENGCDEEFSKIMEILNENCDFEKINSLLPKLYYSDRSKHYFTKQDLIDAVS